jgi:uncharacterized membrane-anchored protein YitT (DUF2179 family)
MNMMMSKKKTETNKITKNKTNGRYLLANKKRIMIIFKKEKVQKKKRII